MANLLGLVLRFALLAITFGLGLYVGLQGDEHRTAQCGTGQICTPTDPCDPDATLGVEVFGYITFILAAIIIVLVVVMAISLYQFSSGSWIVYLLVGSATLLFGATIGMLVTSYELEPRIEGTIAPGVKQCSSRDARKIQLASWIAVVCALLFWLVSFFLRAAIDSYFYNTYTWYRNSADSGRNRREYTRVQNGTRAPSDALRYPSGAQSYPDVSVHNNSNKPSPYPPQSRTPYPPQSSRPAQSSGQTTGRGGNPYPPQRKNGTFVPFQPHGR